MGLVIVGVNINLPFLNVLSNFRGPLYNEYMGTYRMIFRCIIESTGALAANPFASIRNRQKESVSRKEFTQEQVQQIFDYLDSHDEIRDRDEMRLLMHFCCFTGCRGQDACLMRWENIDLEAGTIRYVPRKTERRTNGREAILPIHPMLLKLLLAAPSRNVDEYVLPTLAERYSKSRGTVQMQAMNIIHEATGLKITETETRGKRKIAANLYSLHSFRHTFVSFCANAGVPLEVVASIVGHGSPAMTRHYTHINDQARQNLINALPVTERIGNSETELKRRMLRSFLQTAPDDVVERMAAAFLPSTLVI